MVVPSTFIARVARLRKPAPDFPRRLFFPLTALDKAALGFVAFIFLVFAFFNDGLSLKIDSDQHYHMAVARRTLELGHIPKWDDWEYAPAGRPHLYPPALHLAMAVLAGRPDRLPAAFRILQVFAYPATLLAVWWFIRWLFGDRAGFMGLLLLSMDMTVLTLMLRVVPSGLATALLPLVLAAFLTRRRLATVLLLALLLYIHTAVAVLALVGLFALSLRYRGYLAFFAGSSSWALLLFSPWVLRLAANVSWLTVPGAAVGAGDTGGWARLRPFILGVLWMQFLNPLLAAVAFWGFIKAKDPRHRALRWVIAGFVPMFLFYGGRFWMHTAPLWAAFGGAAAAPVIPKRKPLRAAALLALCTIIPIPSLYFPRSAVDVDVIWSKGGLRKALECIISERAKDADFARLADFIAENTAPREIVHVERSRLYLGDRIYVATGRRVDVGGWAKEVRGAAMLESVEEYRKADTDCLFVYTGEAPEDMAFDRVVVIGRFSVGVRGKARPLEQQAHPPEAALPGAVAP